MPDDNQQPIKPTPAPAVAATPAPAVVVAAAPIKMPEPVHEMTLERYALARSKTCGRNVELLNAFVKMEKRAGNHKGTSAAYDSRYQEFLAKPV